MRLWILAFPLSIPSPERPLFCSAFPLCGRCFRRVWCAHCLCISTMAGTRALPAVRVRELRVGGSGAEARYGQICAVFTPERLADGSFCAIVPADNME